MSFFLKIILKFSKIFLKKQFHLFIVENLSRHLRVRDTNKGKWGHIFSNLAWLDKFFILN